MSVVLRYNVIWKILGLILISKNIFFWAQLNKQNVFAFQIKDVGSTNGKFLDKKKTIVFMNKSKIS